MDSQWLGCRVGKHSFCFDMAEVRAIEGQERVRAGKLNIGGGVEIPVLPLAGLIGVAGARATGPVLVLSDGVVSFGVQVDQVFRDEHRAGSSPVFALPASGHSEICFGLTRLNGTLVPCLEAGRLHPDAVYRWPAHRIVEPNPAPHFDRVIQSDAKRLLCFGASASNAAVKTVCGVSYSQLLEVSQDLRVVMVPGLPEDSCLLGAADWRDAIVPVLDVRRFLDLRNAPTESENLFAILRGVRSAEVFAIPMSEVRTVTLPLRNSTLREAAVDPAMPLRGAFVYQGGKLLLPDFDKALAGLA